MKWHLKSVTQETSHPFLNYFTLHYEVDKEGEKKEYSYFVASRHKKEKLLPETHEISRPDGVTIPLYYIDEKGHRFLLLTKQFRPAAGSYVYSVPAGLMDPNDKDILEVAKREAKEEVGAVIGDLEILSKSGTTSSGLSDETNAIVLGRILSFSEKNLEEFEDISAKLYSFQEARRMLDDDSYFFSNTARLIVLLLLERFKNRQ